jgi:molybdopterin/thiamine biosynthesis adenylyltransferase
MKRIVIAGVGALGSHAALFLRNVEATVRVIDFDRVEQKNTQSQFHGRSTVGKPKVLGLSQGMAFLFGTKLETNPHKLVDDNAKQLLGDADLVLDCLDNGGGRRVVQSFVRASSIPALHGALAPDGGFGRVVWDEDFEIDDESGVAGATCENGEHLPFIAIVSACLARAAQVFLATGRKTGFEINPSGVTHGNENER